MLKRVVMVAGALLLLGAAPTPGPEQAQDQASLRVTFEGLRSKKGSIRLCLFSDADGYPDCTKNASASKHSAPATAPAFVFKDLPPGDYAVSAIHDENDNQKLDKSIIGMPTEGIAFSNNAKVTFGPPKFEKVRFRVEGETAQTLRIRYFL